MAYGSFGDISMVPGYDSVRSDAGSAALGNQPKEESAMVGTLAGQALQANAYLRAQRYQADAAKAAAETAARAANNPLRLITGVLGQGLSGLTGGFGTAVGKAAGAKWFG
jgi:hypothetical protein